MSAVNTQVNQQGYYNLGNSAGTGANAQGAGRTGATGPASRALTQSSSLNGSAAYMLDLSPEAQQYLRGLNQTAQQTTTQQAAAQQDGFVLNSQQRLALASLLEEFKDAPYTQATFDTIQDALHAEGLGPTQLAARHCAESFNPTASLVDALNGGKGTTPGSAPVSEGELEQRSAGYMQFVINEWKKIATPADEGAGAESSDAIAAVENSGGA